MVSETELWKLEGDNKSLLAFSKSFLFFRFSWGRVDLSILKTLYIKGDNNVYTTATNIIYEHFILEASGPGPRGLTVRTKSGH